jgi:hypothetical protein
LDVILLLVFIGLLWAFRDEVNSDVTALEVDVYCEGFVLFENLSTGLFVEEFHLWVEEVDQTALERTVGEFRCRLQLRDGQSFTLVELKQDCGLVGVDDTRISLRGERGRNLALPKPK